MHADVSVRPALEADAGDFARIQRRAWEHNYGDLLGSELFARAAAVEIHDQWEQAVANPPSGRHLVYTAMTGPQIVGFAAMAPVNDETGQIVALEVDPDHLRQGHGARLLAACVDSLRAAGARHIRIWVLEGDQARISFLESAGLADLNWRRELDGGLTEVAYTASIVPD